MKPIYQDPNIPECYRCCIASIFELSKEDVPRFGFDEGQEVGEEVDGLRQQQEVEAWLRERGLFTQTISINDDGLPRPVGPQGLCIAWGEGPRGHSHAVVYDVGDWKRPPSWQDTEEVFVHDPHPSGDGLVVVEGFDCFVVLDPVKFKEAFA